MNDERFTKRAAQILHNMIRAPRHKSENMMSEAPERIWFAPDEAETDENGWSGVVSGKDRLFFETEYAHNSLDADIVEYVRADLSEALDAEAERMRLALRIIAGEEQCLDNLMSNEDVARAAIARETDT